MAWQSYQQPFVAVPPGGPNPSVAAVLGLIPGVGAMYNGQFFKGLIHVVVFVVIISITTHFGLFGLFIPAWILYQSFEAYHTARALRDGEPLPDPLGLNEVGNWLNLGKPPQYPGQPPVGQPPVNPGGYAGPGSPGSSSGWTVGSAGTPPPPYTPPGAYQPPIQGQWQTPYAPPVPGTAAPTDPNAPPPIPPDPSAYWHPAFWRRGAPVGAIVLIALGVLFLLGQLDIFNGRLLEFSWPVFLIGLGVWLVVRRLGESQGGPK
jgi:TM2 domain-containing membrane protein YozV